MSRLALSPSQEIWRVVGDPIHRRIRLNSDEAEIVSSSYFQRLRYIRQTGPAYLVFPSMQGTRFEHSLGVMHIAGKILEELCREENYAGGRNLARDLFRQATRDYRVWIANRLPRKSELYRVLRLAALVHDIGHLPYSHTSEAAFERFLHGAIPSLNMRFHEIVGLEVLRQTRIINDLAVERGVLLVLLSDTEMGRTIGLDRTVFRLLKEIISGEVDADRADYLLRDGLNSGTGFGDYDIDRFVGSLRLAFIGKDLHTLADMRGLSSVESALLERYKLYKYVLWHHKVLLYDELAGRVIRAMFAEPSLAQTFFRHYRGRMTAYAARLQEAARRSGAAESVIVTKTPVQLTRQPAQPGRGEVKVMTLRELRNYLAQLRD